jgi:multiple sugar transport system ATP-binding protein
MYDNPSNVFVAGFIGSPAMNLLTVPVEGDSVPFGDGHIQVPRETVEAAAGERKVTIGVRPEDMELVPNGQGLSTVINLVEELGADAYVYGTADVNGQALDVIARVDGRKPPEKGETVAFAPKPGHLHLFSTTSGERLPT